MEREYDIINELGPRNWLDVAAGEAVVLGFFTKDAELEMRGTALAEELTRVRFDHDGFGKVEAHAMDLTELIAKKKKEKGKFVFIDEICEYGGGKKSLYKWEYSLYLVEGRYLISMMMPEYQGSLPDTEHRELIEGAIRMSYVNPRFEELVMTEEAKIIGHQHKSTMEYHTDDNRLICRVEDFQHEDGPKRGRLISYFMDVCAQAIDTWNEIRTISGRRR